MKSCQLSDQDQDEFVTVPEQYLYYPELLTRMGISFGRDGPDCRRLVLVLALLQDLPLARSLHVPSTPQNLSLSTSGSKDLRIQWAPPADTG